ncbi:hypothetical protein [Actinomadura rupiterrae]|uniref:hypothetical protein n=1 Tax=Actinomadura rupiterrae TaxID=559627 RepID=UPI0020A58154|nr:hypothetical protein [Actinomadura rupiterrae]MCP2337190.1 hypothetical protein [Actinomadura rupiterrae]
MADGAGSLLPELEDAAGPGSAVLVSAGRLADAAAELRDGTLAGVSVADTDALLEVLFEALDRLLGVVWNAGQGTQRAHASMVATGSVWDDTGAARARATMDALEDATVNLSACADALAAAHMLLGHASTALNRIDGNE